MGAYYPKPVYDVRDLDFVEGESIDHQDDDSFLSTLRDDIRSLPIKRLSLLYPELTFGWSKAKPKTKHAYTIKSNGAGYIHADWRVK